MKKIANIIGEIWFVTVTAFLMVTFVPLIYFLAFLEIAYRRSYHDPAWDDPEYSGMVDQDGVPVPMSEIRRKENAEFEDPPYEYYHTANWLRKHGNETYRGWEAKSEEVDPSPEEVEEYAKKGMLPIGYRATFSGLARMMTDDPEQRQFMIDNGYSDREGFLLKPFPHSVWQEEKARRKKEQQNA